MATNDAGGYSVSQGAPDLSNGAGGTLPAGDLSEVLHYTDMADPGWFGRTERPGPDQRGGVVHQRAAYQPGPG